MAPLPASGSLAVADSTSVIGAFGGDEPSLQATSAHAQSNVLQSSPPKRDGFVMLAILPRMDDPPHAHLAQLLRAKAWRTRRPLARGARFISGRSQGKLRIR